MPYVKEWIEPELFMQTPGVDGAVYNIYHAYENEDVEEMLDDTFLVKYVDQDGELIEEFMIQIDIQDPNGINILDYMRGFITALAETGSMSDYRALDI